jgi:hypothetical protein
VSLLFTDSFDHYTMDLSLDPENLNAWPLASKWGIMQFAGRGDLPQVRTHATGGRNGLGYLELNYHDQFGQYNFLGKYLAQPKDEVIVGFAMRPYVNVSDVGGALGTSPPAIYGWDFMGLSRRGICQASALIGYHNEVIGIGRRDRVYIPPPPGHGGLIGLGEAVKAMYAAIVALWHPYGTGYTTFSYDEAQGSTGLGVVFEGLHFEPNGPGLPTSGFEEAVWGNQLGNGPPDTALPGEWHYWEFRIGNGRMTVQRDGRLYGSWEGDVGNQYDTIYLGKIGGQSSWPFLFNFRYDYDDVYMLDTIEPDPVSFLGDVQVTAIRPRAVGTTTGWTPQPDGANWQLVSDRPTPDFDNGLVSARETGLIDTYPMEHVPRRILGAQYVYTTKNVSGTSFKLATVTRRAGQLVGQSVRPSPANYTVYSVPYGLNPLTGVPWVADDFNAPDAEHGMAST